MSFEKPTATIMTAPSTPTDPEKPFGASLCTPRSTPQGMFPASHSTTTLAVTPTREYDGNSTHPFSAFYSHPESRTSFEKLKPVCSTAAVTLSPSDLESGLQTSSKISSELPYPTFIAVMPSKECSQWPGQKTLLAKKDAMKQARVCGPLRRLSKKQRLWAKILIAVLIVGAATGIGIGISKAVGASIWKGDATPSPIGGN